MPYITKIIHQDARYIGEKEARKQNNKEKQKVQKRIYAKYAKWNRSAYNYGDNTSDLVLKNNINAGYNAAKRVSNIVNPDMIK